MTALARKPLLFLLARRLVLILSVFLLLWARPGHAGPMMPADVTVLTRDDFRGRPLFSVADALEGVSSINLEHEGSRGSRTRAKIRGGASGQSHRITALSLDLKGHRESLPYGSISPA